MLVCSATGGYPPITNISLLKNGDVIASAASDSTLQVNTADLPPNINRYGLYVCLVDLSGIQLQQSVVLSERGRLFNVWYYVPAIEIFSVTYEILCVFQINCRYNWT